VPEGCINSDPVRAGPAKTIGMGCCVGRGRAEGVPSAFSRVAGAPGLLAGVPMSSSSSRPGLRRPSVPCRATHGPSSEEPRDPWRWSRPRCLGRDLEAGGRHAAEGASVRTRTSQDRISGAWRNKLWRPNSPSPIGARRRLMESRGGGRRRNRSSVSGDASLAPSPSLRRPAHRETPTSRARRLCGSRVARRTRIP
jgi:hypothetical protein